MTQTELHEALADELHTALMTRTGVPRLSRRHPEFTVDDAYAISLAFLNRRLAAGEKTIGKKIGMTSKAVQDMMGMYQPDFGFLTDRMILSDRSEIALADMYAPRAEAEIALFLKHSLKGPGITPEDVLAATEAVAPSFEIVDTRIENWDIGLIDTIADNASCGVFVVGETRTDPKDIDLARVHCRVAKNGLNISEGYGSAVQGSPLASVAWLANTLGSYGVTLDAGDIILSGSLVPLADVESGDQFEAEISGLGRCSVSFR